MPQTLSLRKVGDKSENESRVFAGFIGTLFFELAAGLSRRSENASNLSFLKASGFRLQG